MAIYFNELTKEFHLMGKNVSYIFNVLRNNQLGHLYYGKKLRHRSSFERLHQIHHRETVSYVFEEDNAFSLTSLKQEYPSYGTTDYREPAHQILQENGSRITNFEYKSHRIYDGKPTLEGLPATYTENDQEAQTLEITLIDELIQVELTLLYTVFEQLNVMARSAKIKNNGTENVNITRVMSASVDFYDDQYEMLQLSGAWSRERHIKTRKLEKGIQKISSTHGASSSRQNPFIALKRPNATEETGEVFGFSFVYSGNFLAQVEVDEYDVSRVMMGINPFDFNWLLESGQEFQAPEVVMVYSDEGLNGMSHTYHELYRTRLARGKWRDKERPVLINNWEGTYFDFNEEKILNIAREAKDLGIELFVLDDGWFGKRDDDTTSLGDWFVDEAKLPNGITGLAKKIKAMGLEFGLWFEPEMVNKISKLYEEHPDWIIHVPGRKQSHGRNQYILDFSRKEVVDHIYQMMADILRDAPISYIKWDMNRFMTEIGSPALSSKRQREIPHRYILGIYDLYERLTSEFPDVLFESCASGGCRFDPGMLYYAPQAWTSDDTDAVERIKIQYGTSVVYPLSSMGAHVSDIPNHQVGRMTSLETRANVAYFGAFGYELDLTIMTEEEKRTVRLQVAFYKENRKLFQYGTFSRMISPFEGENNEASWIVVSEDQKEAVACYYQFLATPHPGYQRVVLTGLNKDFEYQIEGLDGTYFGDELMQAGIMLEKKAPSDYASRLFKLKVVPQKASDKQSTHAADLVLNG
jgi:alpha-galactosidase